MTITQFATDTGSAIDGNDAAITGYSAPATNDILLVAYACGTNGSDVAMAVSGNNDGTFIELSQEYNPTGGDDINLATFYQRVTGTAHTTITCTGSTNADDSCSAILYIMRGVDTVTAIDATTTTANGTNSQPDSPNITSLSTNNWVFSFAANELEQQTIVIPTGMQNILEAEAGDANPCQVGGANIENPGTSYDPAAWTGWTASGSVGWLSATIALRDADQGDGGGLFIPQRHLTGLGVGGPFFFNPLG